MMPRERGLRAALSHSDQTVGAAKPRPPAAVRSFHGVAGNTLTGDAVETISAAIVDLRRLARCFSDQRHREALVKDWLADFRRNARRVGCPIEAIEIVCRVVKDETTGWPGFGANVYRS